MKRFLLVPALLAGGLMAAAPAHAQFGGPAISHPSYADEARQPFYESRRVAYENGYREGLKTGERDARSRDAYSFERERTWQRADKGYHRTYGHRERYRQSFRAGFEAGYSDGYRRIAGHYRPGYGSGRTAPRDVRGTHPTYPGGGRYQYPGYPRGYGYGYGANAAVERGWRDGYDKGREDARKRRAYEPVRHRWYRAADRDYRREYGSREGYQDVYRRAFRDGYDSGYREWAYRR